MSSEVLSSELVLYVIGILTAGAVVAAAMARNRVTAGWIAFVFVGFSAVVLALVVLPVLATGETARYFSGITVPGLGAELSLAVDPLSAIFLLVIAVIATLVTFYSIGYMESYPDENLARYYGPLLLLVAGMIGVVSSSDWFFFLVFWEFMTLASYFLVIFERENPVSLRAGFKYFLMTHAATALMFAAVIITWKSAPVRGFDFATVRISMENMAQARPWLLHLVLAMWFVGFGTKAGVYPFGDWLPDAYPAAPSSGSAAFAGMMTKLGIYGVLRIFADMLPLSSATSAWGIIIAVFGAGSIFIGTITALAQEDSKRLLSFHVIGQVGYMLVGIGTGLYFLPTNPALGALAMIGGIFHVVNHVCYKCLLFLNAGAVRFRTGSRDLGRLGGLAALMPVTGATAVIASMSIAGIPPFNGFASKWLIYESTIVGGMKFPFFIFVGLVAMFVSLVTLASFLKFLGSVFFGKLAAPTDLSKVREVPALMQVPQVVLAGLCVLFGLFPVLPTAFIFRAITAVVRDAPIPAYQKLLGASPIALGFSPGGVAVGMWSPLPMVAVVLGLVAISYGLMRLAGAPVRKVECWYCGEEHADELVRFRAGGLYGPFKHAFDRLYPRIGVPRIAFPRVLERIFDLDSWLYGPFVRAGGRLAQRLSRTHSGIPQIYMLWQVIGVILVLVILVWVLKG